MMIRSGANAVTARRIEEWMSTFSMTERRSEDFGEKLTG
jgi:hypothetical protein